jgi:Amt family ammonium transporter
LAVILKVKMGFDDSLDAFSIHGVGGVLGTIALGIFASYGAKGLLAGNVQQFIAQIGGVIVTILYCGILTVIILKVIDFTIGLRVSEEDEVMGLDLTQHGEEGYKI